MDLAIIAAGEGSRLVADGISTPKPLVRIHGVPLIERIIRSAVRSGADSIFCIINEQSPTLREFLQSQDFGVPLDVTVRSTPSSFHSLATLAPKLKRSPFLLSTVDAVYEEGEFREFMLCAENTVDVGGTLAVTQYVDDEKPLCVEMDDHQRILSFHDTVGSSPWVTGGLYYFAPTMLDHLPEAERSGVHRLRNYLQFLLSRGFALTGFPFQKIIDVDDMNDIKAAEAFLAQHEGPHS